jgi:hypothetical protein
VRVESAFALEMQHLAPTIAERVNAHYGWRCVGRIVLKQGPVRRAERVSRPQLRASAADRQRIAQATGAIAEDGLKEALGRLGEAVLGARDAARPTKA